LKSIETAKSITMQFSSRVMLATRLAALARFRDAEAQLAEAEQLCRLHPTPRNAANVEGLRAALILEESRDLFGSEDPETALGKLAKAEASARKAGLEGRSKDYSTAAEIDKLSQIHAFRARVEERRGEPEKARKERELARARADEAIRAFESAVGP